MFLITPSLVNDLWHQWLMLYLAPVIWSYQMPYSLRLMSVSNFLLQPHSTTFPSCCLATTEPCTQFKSSISIVKILNACKYVIYLVTYKQNAIKVQGRGLRGAKNKLLHVQNSCLGFEKLVHGHRLTKFLCPQVLNLGVLGSNGNSILREFQADAGLGNTCQGCYEGVSVLGWNRDQLNKISFKV